MEKSVLVVCVGNICRSPMAVALLDREFGQRGLKATSAGLAAVVGHPVHPLAQKTLSTRGLSMASHVARRVTLDAIADSDLILAMERRHIDALRALAPRARGRIALFGKWSEGAEVEDPYGRDAKAFEHAFITIETMVSAWAKHL